LTTYDVALTTTTEDELWSHFISNGLIDFERKIYKYVNRLEDVVIMLYQTNPYDNVKWRQRKPIKKYQSFDDWFGNNIEERIEFFNLQSFPIELKRVASTFKWDEDEDKKYQLQNALYEYNKPIQQLKDLEDEMKGWDRVKYEKSYNKWLETDKEWIEKNKKIEEHKGHKPKEYYIKLFAEDEIAKCRYENTIPDNEETCEFCIRDKKDQLEREERERIEKEEQQREEEQYQLEKKRKEEERLNEIKNRPVITYTCDDCGYTCHNKHNHLAHFEDKTHINVVKLKQLYCGVCSTQCRTNAEYIIHINSAKHKKVETGEIKEQYECEPCHYKTKLKQNFDLHCNTKKHQKNVV
jgi:hypothetical protein